MSVKYLLGRKLSGGTRRIPVKWQFRQNASGWKGCIDWSPTGPSDTSSQKRAVSIQMHHCVHLWPCRHPHCVAGNTELPFPVDGHSEGQLNFCHMGSSYAWKKRLWNWSSQYGAFLYLISALLGPQHSCLKPECPIYFSTVGDEREGKHQCLGGSFFIFLLNRKQKKEPGWELYNYDNASQTKGFDSLVT